MVFKAPRCVCLGGPHSDEHLLGSRALQPPELCCALCDVWSPPQSRSHGPSPPGPVALLGCAVHRVVCSPLHGAGPTGLLCRGPRSPELGSTFLGPRCPAGSLSSAPGPAPSEAAWLGAPSVPGQGEAVLLPTWEQEGGMRSPTIPSAYLQNQDPRSRGRWPVTGAQVGGVAAALQPLLALARPLSQGPRQEHCPQGKTHASRRDRKSAVSTGGGRGPTRHTWVSRWRECTHTPPVLTHLLTHMLTHRAHA